MPVKIFNLVGFVLYIDVQLARQSKKVTDLLTDHVFLIHSLNLYLRQKRRELLLYQIQLPMEVRVLSIFF